MLPAGMLSAPPPSYLGRQVHDKAATRVQLRPVGVAAALPGAHCLGHQVQRGISTVGADAVQPHAGRGPLPPLLQAIDDNMQHMVW